ncbi:MAG: ATP synthase F1 subunit delta, partial [Candidatus Kapaibacteriota bacterium]
MAEQKVSYRYAKAVFESALEERKIEQFYNDFMFVLNILSSVPELMSLAKKPLISSFRKKKLFHEIFHNSISEPTLNFILFLVDKNRDYLLKNIIHQFQKLYYSYKNYLPVEIYLPKDFEDGIKNKIVNRIEQNTGMKVVPKFII